MVRLIVAVALAFVVLAPEPAHAQSPDEHEFQLTNACGIDRITVGPTTVKARPGFSLLQVHVQRILDALGIQQTTRIWIPLDDEDFSSIAASLFIKNERVEGVILQSKAYWKKLGNKSTDTQILIVAHEISHIQDLVNTSAPKEAEARADFNAGRYAYLLGIDKNATADTFRDTELFQDSETHGKLKDRSTRAAQGWLKQARMEEVRFRCGFDAVPDKLVTAKETAEDDKAFHLQERVKADNRVVRPRAGRMDFREEKWHLKLDKLGEFVLIERRNNLFDLSIAGGAERVVGQCTEIPPPE